MGPGRLVLRGLTYYWRTYAAVILGVATAVAVLAGALLVGDSVRGSLRALVLQRLGQTDVAVVSAGFFREQLALQLANARTPDAAFRDVCPIVMLDALVTDQASGREAHQVRVYGVDDRFWRFHGVAAQGPADREALVSLALAGRIGAEAGHTILVRVQRPSAIPLESLQGRKDNLGRTMRLDVRAVVQPADMGEFSLDPRQGEIRAVFVPLSRLQQELDLEGKVNVILVSSNQSDPSAVTTAVEQRIKSEAALEDVGLTVRTLNEPNAISIGSDAGLLTDAQAAVAEQTLAGGGFKGQPSFTYLANSMRLGERSIPYSLVTAMDLQTLGLDASVNGAVPDAIVLNEWAAAELRAHTGDVIGMDYYVWEDPGQLVTRTADFRVAGVVPITAADRDLAPVLPGISDSPSLADWDPPFPVDLRRVRPVDEAYWDRYRTTPKAFVPLAVGQRLWRSRYGAVTAIRVPAPRGADNERVMSLQSVRDKYAQDLRAAIDPLAMGLAVRAVKAEGLAASAGATDFGEYFTYFSFFLVVSALLLAALVFKLGVEQRAREVGLLRAVGFSPAAVRRLFVSEGVIVAVIGSAIGVVGAIGYASLITIALRTWWVDAVSTTAITLHVSAVSLVAGALGGVAAAVACIWWTLRGLARVSERSLLAGELGQGHAFQGTTASAARIGYAAGALTAGGAALLVAGATGVLDGTGAFFGAGTALLGASLCAFAVVLRRPGKALGGHGWLPLSRLGFRNTTFRPGRSVLSMAVIASATFILISVDAFRRGGTASPTDPHGGGGGYPLIVESLVPIGRDPNTAEGREAMNLFDLDSAVRFEPFRVLPGDDASCLNLYEPRNPRIMAPTDAFLAAGRFSFQSSLAETPAETANPWLLLHTVPDRGQTGVRHLSDTGSVIPVIADANSMTYVLHKKLGEDIVIPHGSGELHLRLVAALSDSIFQGELLMSQENFREFFPEQEGYRFFLVDAPQDRADAVAAQLEDAMSDVGAEVTGTAERLAEFHKVENTYLSTFQTLGGLGLLLGTVGLATVVLRNVLERRRELALLAAVGYRRRHFLLMIVAENVALLAAGLAAGAVCAGLAILPAVAERGGRVPLTSGGALLLLAVFITGLLSSVVATRAAIGGPLLASLRSE